MVERPRGPAPRINSAPSSVLAHSLPVMAVLLGSLAPLLPLIASAPLVPPLGYLVLIAWLQMRPGLFPVWAGLPLGLFDDLYSGQPLGSGMVLWSITVIALEIVETRFPWRGFVHDWLVAGSAITIYLLASLLIANLAGATAYPAALIPQLIVSLLLYPLIARLVGAIDRARLLPVRSW